MDGPASALGSNVSFLCSILFFFGLPPGLRSPSPGGEDQLQSAEKRLKMCSPRAGDRRFYDRFV